jgi:hypothetical protein
VAFSCVYTELRRVANVSTKKNQSENMFTSQRLHSGLTVKVSLYLHSERSEYPACGKVSNVRQEILYNSKDAELTLKCSRY